MDAVSRGVLGLGAASTSCYLQEIHKRYQKANEEFSTCPLLLYQIDFQEINPFLPSQFLTLIPKVQRYLEEISNFGITKLLVPNITLHETLDQIETPLQICHPVDLTLKYLQDNAIGEVCIFGTLHTMNSHYLKSKFSAKKISLLKPKESDQNWIDDFRKKVYLDKTTSEEERNFHNLIQKYSKDKPVLIACTELSIFSPKDNFSCIDMMDLQIEEFLKVN